MAAARLTTSCRGHMASAFGARIGSAPRPRTTQRRQAVGVAAARYSAACSSAFSRVGTSHQIDGVAFHRGDLLGGGPALAGALAAGDQRALADLGQRVDAVLGEHLRA